MGVCDDILSDFVYVWNSLPCKVKGYERMWVLGRDRCLDLPLTGPVNLGLSFSMKTKIAPASYDGCGHEESTGKCLAHNKCPFHVSSHY